MLPSLHPVLRVLLVAGAAAALVACGDKSAGAKGQPGAGGAAPAAEVGVITVAPRNISLTTELPGRVSAFLVAEVRPQVGGIVKTRSFREGTDVKAGQTLYQIDPATYRATVQSAEAALARAQASVASAKALAARYKDLVKIDAVSRQAVDDADAAALQGEADVASARAQLATARINLDYTRVTAPISGRIGRSSVTAGALVTASQADALATIQALDTVYVDVTQSSAELLRLRRDLAAGRLTGGSNGDQATVRLKLEDGSDYGMTGKLQFSDVTVDEQTSAVTLRAVFPNPNKLLLPNMYVRAVLEEGVRENAITVPQQAVARNSKGEPTAMVVGADGKVQPRALKTPRTIGDQWLVDSGLQAGDQVVVEGLQKARPGAQVKAVPYNPAAAAAGASAPAGAASAPAGGASAAPAAASAQS